MIFATPSPWGRCSAGIAPALIPPADLFHLATFLGHVHPSSTAVYLMITPELLHEANRRFERLAAPARAEASS